MSSTTRTQQLNSANNQASIQSIHSLISSAPSLEIRDKIRVSMQNAFKDLNESITNADFTTNADKFFNFDPEEYCTNNQVEDLVKEVFCNTVKTFQRNNLPTAVIYVKSLIKKLNTSIKQISI